MLENTFLRKIITSFALYHSLLFHAGCVLMLQGRAVRAAQAEVDVTQGK
jgi:hypothetical protein